jgi:hypothetical protein
MNAVSAFTYETYYLGQRTTRRFLRVPANFISIIFFPLIQLLAFSQLFQDIVMLPGFGAQDSYLAYLVPGQVVFTAFMVVGASVGASENVGSRLSGIFSGPVQEFPGFHVRAHWSELRGFYEGRQYRPVWVDDAGPTSKARDLVRALSCADTLIYDP